MTLYLLLVLAIWYFSPFLIVLYLCFPLLIGNLLDSYHGISFVYKGILREFNLAGDGKTAHSQWYNVLVEFPRKKSPIKKWGKYDYNNPKVGSKVLVEYQLDRECELSVHLSKIILEHRSEIHDFAFVEDNTFYSYHDFSIKYPNLVYELVGYNIVYAATRGPAGFRDTIDISFTDILGEPHKIKCNIAKYEYLPDTFLVYKNINEDVSDRFVVCDKSVNTPDNWRKISDYGYIFHYDVYSKEEVESQCPRIREYVEKYKERNMRK